MNKTQMLNPVVRKTAVTLIALALMLGCFCGFAGAEALPDFNNRRADAVLEDFTGIWGLRWVRSEAPVDMSTFAYVDIYPDGKADVNVGSVMGEAYYSTSVQEAGDGYLYAPNTEGEGGYYFFVVDDETMGCVDTLENPAVTLYLEFNDEIYDEDEADEYDEDAFIAERIYEHIGEQCYEISPEELQGSWYGFEYTVSEAELCPLYVSGSEMTLMIEGDNATMTYSIGGEETTYETPVYYDSDYAEIMDEYGEESQYLILTGDGKLVLLDDVANPGDAIFFLTQEAYEEAMADVDYNARPQPGEQLVIGDIAELEGEWTATHINYGGMIYPVQTMGMEASIIIDADGGIQICDDDIIYFSGDGRIEDGYIAIQEDEDDESYLFHYEGGFLIYSEYADDLSMVTYFQRLDHSGDE